MVINVLHSIGDIIFCEPIYSHYWKLNGMRPTVIIRDHLMWLQDYIPSARFMPASQYSWDIDRSVISSNYLPLRFANPIMRGLDKWDHSDYENCMNDKYLLAELDPSLWKTLQLQFDIEKAKKLFAYLDLSSEDSYIVVNENSQAGKISIKPETDMRIIYMKEIKDFNVCDWAMIMLLAKENHHISTSTFFILQALTDYKGKIFLYPRPNEDGFRGISQLKPSFNYTKMKSTLDGWIEDEQYLILNKI